MNRGQKYQFLLKEIQLPGSERALCPRAPEQPASFDPTALVAGCFSNITELGAEISRGHGKS